MKPKYGHLPLHTPDKVYFIGDVHNEGDKLISLLDQIEPLLTPNDHVVFLGDLVDRGKQAALTMEVLVDFTRKHPDQVYFVRGNHDWMLQNYLMTGNNGWMSYLKITLDSYMQSWGLPDIFPDTIAKALLDKGFREITSRMVPYYETEETIGTHAPLDQSVVLMNGGDYYDEYWANEGGTPDFQHLLDKMDFEILWQFTGEELAIPCIKKFRVCGHQPGHAKNPRIFKDRAFIDTGAGKGKRPITCLVYPGKKYYQSKPEDA
jgi:hypothetical protein